MKKAHIKIGIFAGIILAVTFLIGTTFVSPGVQGVNVTTKVTVSNAPPTVYEIIVTPNPISLTVGTTTQIACNGSVFDFDGYTDIVAVNATLYEFNVGSDAADDNNDHYTNDSCSSTCSSISATNGSCQCLFNVDYYANNGTWACNLTVGDSGFFNASGNDSVALQTLVGVGLPPEIDFGNLALSSISQNITANVTNFGNVAINSSIRGFGGIGGDAETQNANASMNCSSGSIPIENLRYAFATDKAFADMDEINSTDREFLNYSTASRVNDANAADSFNISYWRLQMPTSGIAGVCNGTLIFTAIEQGIQ